MFHDAIWLIQVQEASIRSIVQSRSVSQEVSQMFDDMEGVETYIDNILVFGRSHADHDERLKQVLERCRAQNFRLNRKKCKFSQSSVLEF